MDMVISGNGEKGSDGRGGGLVWDEEELSFLLS